MLYRILPKKSFQFDNQKMLMFFKTISNVKSKKSFLKQLLSSHELKWIFDCDKNNKISIYIDVDEGVNENIILNALKVLFQDRAEVFITNPIEKHDAYNTLAFKKDDKVENKLLPFTSPAVFLNIIGLLQSNTRLEISFKVLKRFFQSTNSNKMNDVEIEAVIQVTGKTKYMRNDVMTISQSIASLTANNDTLWLWFKNTYKPIKVSSSEIMNLIQIPTLNRADDTLLNMVYHLLPGQITLKDSEYSQGIYTGVLDHPIYTDRKVYINKEHLRKHALISGTTGSGKSAEIEEWIGSVLKEKIKDIDAPGFTFFDPLESSVLGVIDKINKLKADGENVDELLKKVHYIDLSNDRNIFPIALLNKACDPTEVLDFFKSLYGEQQAIQVDRMMATAISTILKDTKEHSVFDIEKIFDDQEFRDNVQARLKGNVYAQDEINFLKNTKFNQQVSAPIYNRLASFKNTMQKKLMFALPSKYDALKDIRKWMDEGHIVLFNLKGLSKFDIEVIIGYVTMQYYLQAKMRPDFSKQHLLIVDEAHQVQMPIFPKICAEMRKSGLTLVLVTQMLEQFKPDYMELLIGNINTIISFKQKARAATELQRRIPSQDVMRDDLLKLPSLIGYLSMEEGGKERSILIKTQPPYRYTNGKMVNHLDVKEVQENLNINRKIASDLMQRDFMTKEKAESIVFMKIQKIQEMESYEMELLEAGDSLSSANMKGMEMIWED